MIKLNTSCQHNDSGRFWNVKIQTYRPKRFAALAPGNGWSKINNGFITAAKKDSTQKIQALPLGKYTISKQQQTYSSYQKL